MTPDVQAAIVRAAQEQGIDPSFALAVAQRESKFNPNAHASRTMYGLFQMSGNLRSQYGAGDSTDPYTQASGWGHFITDTRNELSQRLGRDPTNEETYLAHYFGTGRAARLISGQIPASADVRDVFTPQEIAANPEFAKAGTVGNLMASVEGDIGKRIGSFGGIVGGIKGGSNPVQSGPDFAAFGQAPQGTSMYNDVHSSDQPVDFAALGAAMTETGPADNSGSAAQAPPAETAAPAPPAPPAQVTPAMVAMRNAMAPLPQVQNMPAIPGQQPQPQGTA